MKKFVLQIDFKMGEPNEENQLYIVQSVDKVLYNKAKKRIEYKVTWEEVDGENEETDEPLHNLQNCPLLFYNYELETFEEWKRTCGNKNPETRKPPLPGPLRNLRWNLAKYEYCPTGKEYVQKIYTTWTSPTNAMEFFYVKFESSRERRIVRRTFMDYYFPIDVLSFWKKIGKEMT